MEIEKWIPGLERRGDRLGPNVCDSTVGHGEVGVGEPSLLQLDLAAGHVGNVRAAHGLAEGPVVGNDHHGALVVVERFEQGRDLKVDRRGETNTATFFLEMFDYASIYIYLTEPS